MGRPAIFLDRDGTIIEDKHYLASIREVEWIERAPEALRALRHAGFWIIVITNQSGVARGIFDEACVGEIHRHMNLYLETMGAQIDGFYHCPHHPEAGSPLYKRDCDCRKPRPGLIWRAANELGIELNGSYFIGDKISDVEAGLGAGVTPILVLTGKGKEQRTLLESRPHLKGAVRVFPSLWHAAQWILEKKLGQGEH